MPVLTLRRATGASRTLIIVEALALALLTLLCFAAPALAQTPVPGATPVPDPQIVTTSRPVPAAGQLITLAIVVLVFAFAVIGALLLYINGIQKRFYDAAEKFAKAGVTFDSTSPPTFSRSSGGGGVNFEAKGDEEPAGPPVEIKGPAKIAVGVESPEFTAERDGKALADASWSVEPSNAALILPNPNQARIKVLAGVAGRVTLRVHSAAADMEATAELMAVPPGAPVDERSRLPFVGAGYGSIIIAIALLGAVIVLALAGVLNGDGVSSLLGGLLGYIFGVGVGAATAERSNAPKS